MQLQIRPTTLVPLFLSLTAFILSMLCIFAGSKTGFLESADLLTLNTSMLGESSVTTSSTSKTASSTLNTINNDLHKGVNKLVVDIAKELNIHDFYSAHILDYCELRQGYYTPTAISNATSHPQKNVTFCSNQTTFFHFDPTSIIQKELKPGVNISDLQWPSAVQETVRVVELSSKAMFLFYSMGAVIAGFTLIGALIGLKTSGRIYAIANVMISLLGFFSLMIASAISTAVIDQVVDSVNTYGNSIGIAASKGMTFIGMTWAADLLILLTSFAWVFEFIKGRREMMAYAE